MKHRGWLIFQIIQFVFFLGFSIFLFTRTIDGHGAVQTLEVKLISFAVWAVFFLAILAIEWIIFFIAQRKKR